MSGFEDTSGLEPWEFMVLVKPREFEEKIGSVYLPEEVRDRHQYAVGEGTLVAVSPAAFTYHKWPEGTRLPQPGDTVVFRSYAGYAAEGADGVKYRFMTDKDICGTRSVSAAPSLGVVA